MSHLSRGIFKTLPIAIWDYFAWMIKYSSKKRQKYAIDKRYRRLQKLIKKVSDNFEITYHIEGKENLPDGPLAFFPNHSAGFDPIAFIYNLDKPTAFVAKKEIKKWPAVNRCVKVIDGEFMDRDDLKQSLKVMMRVEKSLKQGNMNWIIFPEGTRNKDPLTNLRDFHHGSFRPAVKAGVPIVPVAIYGTYRILSNKYKKYPVYIKFLKPLMPEDYQNMSTQEIAQYAHDEVQKALSFDLLIKDHKFH